MANRKDILLFRKMKERNVTIMISEKIEQKLMNMKDEDDEYDKIIDLLIKTNSKRIKEVLERNYKICYHASSVTKTEHIKEDMHQRLDELCLIYSDIFETSVVDAKKHLEERAKEIIKEERKECEY